LTIGRGRWLERVTEVGPGIQPTHDVQTWRFDDALERAACLDREADRAAADGQARDAVGSLRSEHERRGRADVGADDMRSSEAPLVDQTGQERTGGIRGDQFRAAVRVSEARHVDGDNPPDRRDAIPNATERPEAFGPRRQHQNGDARVCLRVGEPYSRAVADSEVGGDQRTCLRAHVAVSLPYSFESFVDTRGAG